MTRRRAHKAPTRWPVLVAAQWLMVVVVAVVGGAVAGAVARDGYDAAASWLWMEEGQ